VDARDTVNILSLTERYGSF